MALSLHTSNRLEILVNRLADLVQARPLSPLVPERIVVQSRGMARWLALELASRLGGWANADCPFPNAFFTDIFRRVLPQETLSADDRDTMAWRLMALFAEQGDGVEFAGLAGYLAGSSARKRFLFAWQLADLFDQYLIYRPDLIRGWEEGGGTGFQPELWRQLAIRQPAPHRAILLERCLKRLAAPDFDPAVLPPRVSVFGVSALPPYHIELFSALSRHIDVHCFLMNPCQEYWADIVSVKEGARISRQKGLSADTLYLETGNSLLAAMARQGRDFFSLIQGLECQEETLFVEPESSSLLASVQADILNLAEATPFPPDPAGVESIVFYSCHSPMREVETLKDHLLGLFNQKPDLQASDILVMTPDIETYGPLIQAVFDADANDPLRIPFSIADRGQRSEGRLITAFLAICDLAGSRFEVSKVLGLLETEAVRKRFGITERDCDLIRRWASELNIRWGLDQEEREGLNLPGFGEYSWQAGLDRLLLGLAMCSETRQPFAGILPSDAGQGGKAALLGSFLEFFDTMADQVAQLKQTFTLAGWAEHLSGLLAALFQEDDATVAEILLVRQALTRLGDQQELAAFGEKVGIAVVRTYLVKMFDAGHSSGGFLSGGVTFGAMLPMRAVPFQVICLLGINDGEYPRRSRHLSFDLMAKEPRPGDRSTRNDDRYLFLETILSARSQLYISYVGQSPRDNRQRPPSVLVSELLDYLGRKTGVGKPEENLVNQARLQPFDPDYFRPSRTTKSFARENFSAAQALFSPRRTLQPLVSEPLSEPDDQFRQVTVDDLGSFFVHPVKYFCRNRLGIILPEGDAVLEDREPFSIEGLSRYQLESDMVEWRLAGRTPESFFSVAKAAGALPPAAMGEAFFADLAGQVEVFSARTAPLLAAPLPDLPVDFALGDFQITGRLHNIKEQAMVAFRPTKLKAKDQVRAWIRHLVLNVVAAPGYPCLSQIAGTDKVICFRPVPEASDILARLLALYWQGMAQPLVFFPESSLAFSEQIARGADQQTALAKAGKAWEGSSQRPGESVEPYNELCFANTECLDEVFVEQAEAFFTPLLAHREVES